ncbi:OmpP1/FadL family transporter [Acinetobacter baumannii]|uniref:OmpP1/FadL family transporter n=1 Tax=Acinetobacter baumannii TaxID=470 RepID=UPI003B430E8E
MKNISIVALCMISPALYAYNGTLLTGTGQISSGMGGVSYGGGFDRSSIADNPANLSYQDAGRDIQLSILNIHSESSFIDPNQVYKSKQYVPVPSLSLVRHADEKLSYGIAVVGSGASVNYRESVTGSTQNATAKDNLAMATINPTLSYKIKPNISMGAALHLGAQQFRAKGVIVGLDADQQAIELPAHGNQWAWGYGYTLGVTWHFLPHWTLGASYISETKFSKLDGYHDDLLASSKGSLNLPMRIGAGLSYQPNEKIKIGFDVLRINWQDADGFGHGTAFNWQDQTVYRMGVDYQVNGVSSVRAGYSQANSFLDTDYANANLYTNSIANKAITLGYGHRLGFADLNIAYEYDLSASDKGTGPSIGTNLKNHNHTLTLGFAKSF